MVKNNQKVFILVIVLIIFISINYKGGTQSVAPSCFEKEDCAVAIKVGYCGVDYDCLSGTCYSEQILCPETCYGGGDEDMDNLIDCDDPDCYDSIYCPCSKMYFNDCIVGRCYCEEGLPHWVIEGEVNICDCR